MTFEICMPTHKSAKKIITPFDSFLKQTYKDFYITIFDNTPLECEDEIIQLKEVIRTYQEKGLKINFIKNDRNLGVSGNIKKIFEHHTGDLFMIMADDDILSSDAIQICVNTFITFPNAGMICRPYYSFLDDKTKAVRFHGPIYQNVLELSLESDFDIVHAAITSAGQISGLVFKSQHIEKYPIPETDIFTVQMWPILDIIKKSSIIFLNIPILAVSIKTSQCQSNIYGDSPVSQYYRLYNHFLSEPRYKNLKRWFMKQMTGGNLVGFAQIKNYGTLKQTLREIYLYAKYYKWNLLNPLYYIFAVGVLIIPRFILIPLIDFYKNRILARKIQRSVKIDYSRF